MKSFFLVQRGEEMMKKGEQAFEPASSNTNEDDEIEPLSGNPYFDVTLCKSHVSSPYQLIVPAESAHTLPRKTIPVTLTRGKKCWKTTYYGRHATHKRFDLNSWKIFAVDNKLKVGDACVFELMAHTDAVLDFKVQILRDDFPSILLEKEDGTSNSPVVVE